MLTFSDFFKIFHFLPLFSALHNSSEEFITIILRPWPKAPISRPRLEVSRLLEARSRRWTWHTKRTLLDTESISRLWTWTHLIKRSADKPISNYFVVSSDKSCADSANPRHSCENYDGRSTSSFSRCSSSPKLCNSWTRLP